MKRSGSFHLHTLVKCRHCVTDIMEPEVHDSTCDGLGKREEEPRKDPECREACVVHSRNMFRKTQQQPVL